MYRHLNINHVKYIVKRCQIYNELFIFFIIHTHSDLMLHELMLDITK